MQQYLITIAKCYTFFFLFVFDHCPVVLGNINRLGSLLNHAVIVDCQVPIAFEELTACSVSVRKVVSQPVKDRTC